MSFKDIQGSFMISKQQISETFKKSSEEFMLTVNNIDINHQDIITELDQHNINASHIERFFFNIRSNYK